MTKLKTMTVAEMKAALRDMPIDLLKLEIIRRRDVDRATRHIKSAEEALIRAQAKLKLYQSILKDDHNET